MSEFQPSSSTTIVAALHRRSVATYATETVPGNCGPGRSADRGPPFWPAVDGAYGPRRSSADTTCRSSSSHRAPGTPPRRHGRRHHVVELGKKSPRTGRVDDQGHLRSRRNLALPHPSPLVHGPTGPPAVLVFADPSSFVSTTPAASTTTEGVDAQAVSTAAFAWSSSLTA